MVSGMEFHNKWAQTYNWIVSPSSSKELSLKRKNLYFLFSPLEGNRY